MSKRSVGRPPSGPYRNKSVQLSTRIRPDTHASLKLTAKGKGRSVSQEVEHRLRTSFEAEKKFEAIIRSFGGEMPFTVFQLMAQCMNGLNMGTKDRWYDHPKLFAIAVEIAREMLLALKPEDTKEPLPEYHIANTLKPTDLAKALVHGTLSQVGMAGDVADGPVDGLPNEGGGRTYVADHLKLAPLQKQRLGDLAHRIGSVVPYVMAGKKRKVD